LTWVELFDVNKRRYWYCEELKKCFTQEEHDRFQRILNDKLSGGYESTYDTCDEGEHDTTKEPVNVSSGGNEEVSLEKDSLILPAAEGEVTFNRDQWRREDYQREWKKLNENLEVNNSISAATIEEQEEGLDQGYLGTGEATFEDVASSDVVYHHAASSTEGVEDHYNYEVWENHEVEEGGDVSFPEEHYNEGPIYGEEFEPSHEIDSYYVDRGDVSVEDSDPVLTTNHHTYDNDAGEHFYYEDPYDCLVREVEEDATTVDNTEIGMHDVYLEESDHAVIGEEEEEEGEGTLSIEGDKTNSYYAGEEYHPDTLTSCDGRGWIKLYSSEYQQHYYFNEESGVSTWEIPSEVTSTSSQCA
jgi:hypothetical protein